MKQVHRIFIVVISVPDDVKLDDCEVTVDKLTASYRRNGEYAEVPPENISVYEHMD